MVLNKHLGPGLIDLLLNSFILASKLLLQIVTCLFYIMVPLWFIFSFMWMTSLLLVIVFHSLIILFQDLLLSLIWKILAPLLTFLDFRLSILLEVCLCITPSMPWICSPNSICWTASLALVHALLQFMSTLRIALYFLILLFLGAWLGLCNIWLAYFVQ